MWYVDPGYVPTVEEAKAKLNLLNAKGSTAEAFSMSELYDESGNRLVK